MKYLRLFEAWEHRYPKQIRQDEVDLKLKTFRREYFTDEEVKFFEKIHTENRGLYDYYFMSNDQLDMNLYNMGNDPDPEYGDGLINITLTKLEDDWYIIEVSGLYEGDGYYLADELDEVIGFLGTETSLKINDK
jgi:hypothetical protein